MESPGFSPTMVVRVLLLSHHRIRTLTHHLLHHLNPHISRISQNPISTSLVGQAEEFFEEVKSEFETGAKSYSILMKGWSNRGNGEDALRVFDKMLERGCVVDVVAYNTLLASLCRGGLRDID